MCQQYRFRGYTHVFLASSRFPAFYLKCPAFLRISSWIRCAQDALRRLGNQFPVLCNDNSH